MKKFCFLLFFFLLCIKFEYFDSFFFVLYKYNVCFEYLKKNKSYFIFEFFYWGLCSFLLWGLIS